MQKLKIAASAVLKDKLQVDREVVKLSTADFTEVSAVVIDIEDYRKGGLNSPWHSRLPLPSRRREHSGRTRRTRCRRHQRQSDGQTLIRAPDR